MIQRIQSIFLFLVALAMVGVLVLPMWQKIDPATGEKLTLTAFSITSEAGRQVAPNGAISHSERVPVSTWPIGALAIVAAGVALYEIFQYRNRLRQMQMGLLNSVVLAGVLGALVYYVIYVAEPMMAAPTAEQGPMLGDKLIGFWMPFVGLVGNLLANRFIRRDENLVRSADRLR